MLRGLKCVVVFFFLLKIQKSNLSQIVNIQTSKTEKFGVVVIGLSKSLLAIVSKKKKQRIAAVAISKYLMAH